jgi:hypothetical protein
VGGEKLKTAFIVVLLSCYTSHHVLNTTWEKGAVCPEFSFPPAALLMMRKTDEQTSVTLCPDGTMGERPRKYLDEVVEGANKFRL